MNSIELKEKFIQYLYDYPIVADSPLTMFEWILKELETSNTPSPSLSDEEIIKKADSFLSKKRKVFFEDMPDSTGMAIEYDDCLAAMVEMYKQK